MHNILWLCVSPKKITSSIYTCAFVPTSTSWKFLWALDSEGEEGSWGWAMQWCFMAVPSIITARKRHQGYSIMHACMMLSIYISCAAAMHAGDPSISVYTISFSDMSQKCGQAPWRLSLWRTFGDASPMYIHSHQDLVDILAGIKFHSLHVGGLQWARGPMSSM